MTVASREKNDRRRNMVKQYEARRARLKKIIYNRELEPGERFEATLQLAELPRNSSPTRVRNRCALTNRPRGYYRKFRMSRIMLREIASRGQVPGVKKASW